MPRQPVVGECIRMLPLSDSVPARRFPLVNTAIIIANLAVWLLYKLPTLNRAVADASFYPCTVDGSCDGPLPWAVSWLTSMFMHGSWSHILGNMLFLFVFGKNVEDAFGHVRYLGFYLAGGFAATMTQTAATLLAGTAADAQVPNLGASGAIAAVLGAYLVLYPTSQIRGLIGIFPVRISAWFYLGLLVPLPALRSERRPFQREREPRRRSVLRTRRRVRVRPRRHPPCPRPQLAGSAPGNAPRTELTEPTRLAQGISAPTDSANRPRREDGSHASRRTTRRARRSTLVRPRRRARVGTALGAPLGGGNPQKHRPGRSDQGDTGERTRRLPPPFRIRRQRGVTASGLSQSRS
jgi:membrane associated rhomboid family serine protease